MSPLLYGRAPKIRPAAACRILADLRAMIATIPNRPGSRLVASNAERL